MADQVDPDRRTADRWQARNGVTLTVRRRRRAHPGRPVDRRGVGVRHWIGPQELGAIGWVYARARRPTRSSLSPNVFAVDSYLWRDLLKLTLTFPDQAPCSL